MCTSKYEHTEKLLIFLHEGFLRYHNHKENMAWAGTAAFVAAFGAALISKDWPPAWVSQDLFWQRIATSIGITIIAVLAGIFVKWQLRNRRWASIRVDAIEYLLFTWLGNPPRDEDLKGYEAPKDSPKGLCRTQKVFKFVKDSFWPSKKIYTKESSLTGAPLETYPQPLIDTWIDYEKHGRGAPISHERLITVTMWVFYVAVLVRTIIN